MPDDEDDATYLITPAALMESALGLELTPVQRHKVNQAMEPLFLHRMAALSKVREATGALRCVASWIAAGQAPALCRGDDVIDIEAFCDELERDVGGPRMQSRATKKLTPTPWLNRFL